MMPDDQAALVLAGRVPVPASERDGARQYVRAFDEAWCEYAIRDLGPSPRDLDWSVSVRRWRERGLDLDTLLQFVDRVLEGDRFNPSQLDAWKYLCGMATRHLNERGL